MELTDRTRGACIDTQTPLDRCHRESFDTLPCCGIKTYSHPGRQEKHCWLQANAEFGLQAKTLLAPDGQPSGYIEYVPGEFAWRGVDASGYVLI